VGNTENIISLCTGYGGIELGLKRVSPNFCTVCYVEVEAFAVANLVAKIETGKLDSAPIWTDVKTFPSGIFRGKVHGITGGYPCQPFSVAGKRQGTDDPRHLWPHIARIVQAVRPVWCFFENVAGHLTLGFPEVYRSLRDMGYAVEAGLFTAAECGAPHRRQRLFILAHNETRRINQERPIARYSPQNWPSRPGQPQYEWEEPRIMADTKGGRPTGTICKCNESQNARRSKDERCNVIESVTSRTKRQTQSSVGGAVNGAASRVDRLRLLGNGVVPQQAEKAFRTLMALFGDKS